MLTPQVDVVVLTRNSDPVESTVIDSIEAQAGVDVHLRRVVGEPRPTDTNRWQTIARARNIGRTLGQSPLIMFVDDDVVLGDSCIAKLVKDLEQHHLDAVAADYLGEQSVPSSRHVAMGATLFKRSVLAQISFRSTSTSCECRCMTDDLREAGFRIEYSPTASARHLRASRATCSATQQSKPTEPIIMTAFDRSHMGIFTGRFLKSLRDSGNINTVHAVVYGLRTKDLQTLRRLANVQVHSNLSTARQVCRARMIGFQKVLREVHPETPVAYWDAGDVLFQTRLNPLWHQVESMPDKLLVVSEPLHYADNKGQQAWIESIHDPTSRAKAKRLLRGRPVINGGFIAGVSHVLHRYFARASESADGRMLGAGGGDQVVLNAAVYENHELFELTDETWNYCLAGRSGRTCKIRDGRYIDVRNERIVSVVHGNAGTLRA